MQDIHPTLKILLRAYGLGWGITTVPALLSLIIKALSTGSIGKAMCITLPVLLKKSMTENGLPWLMAGSIGGQKLMPNLDHKKSVFITSFLSILCVRRYFPHMKTLDLTFFMLVRAIDVFAQRCYHSSQVRKKVPEWVLEYGNIGVFMLASTEIIYSWFYEPERLPKSYSMWITQMSGIDVRLLKALRAIKAGTWVYGKDTGMGSLLGDYCVHLGLPRSYGDPIEGRIDCSVVHEGSLWGCEANALTRFSKGFIKIFPLYLSVHLLPALFFRRTKLLEDPAGGFRHILGASVRSSAFLGTYIGIIWYCICLVRTRIGHQLLGVDQTLLDDTLGPLVGSMFCGLSLLIESKHRRGEMTLYVVPRALFSLTERILSPHQKGRWWEQRAADMTENIVLAASIATVVHTMYKEKTMVRPSTRGILSWILKEDLEDELALK